MSKNNEKAIDQILDLLLDALSERQQDRMRSETLQPSSEELQGANTDTNDIQDEPATRETELIEHDLESTGTDDSIESETGEELSYDSVEPVDSDSAEFDLDAEYAEVYLNPPEKLPSINMNKIFYRLSIALALLIVLVNIPFNRYGTNLARAMPDEQALIVRNGLIFTGPGSEVYILEDNQKRWISSLTAFDLLGFRWEQVHEVDQAFVDQFEDGPDLHVIIRCNNQPHIYLLEGGEKRWIENPAAFEKAGLKWDDVRYISCFDLKNKYPDGVPIPSDAGDPPQW